MTTHTDLRTLELGDLRKLFLKESREFLFALDGESFEELQKRRDRMREIDEEILTRKMQQ